MAKNKTIKQVVKHFSAVLMLIAVVCVITPKSYLHNIFADHRDTYANLALDDRHHLNESGSHCTTDFFVTTSPFYQVVPEFSITTFVSETCRHDLGMPLIPTSATFYFTLRGPPVLG